MSSNYWDDEFRVYFFEQLAIHGRHDDTETEAGPSEDSDDALFGYGNSTDPLDHVAADVDVEECLPHEGAGGQLISPISMYIASDTLDRAFDERIIQTVFYILRSLSCGADMRLVAKKFRMSDEEMQIFIEFVWAQHVYGYVLH